MGISSNDAQPDASMDMLRLMADPEKLAARIKEYDDARAAAETAIALAGQAAEIPALHAEALRLKNEAEANAVAAQAAADKTVTDANAKADSIADDVQAWCDKTKSGVEKVQSDADASLKSAQAIRAESETYVANAKTKANGLVAEALDLADSNKGKQIDLDQALTAANAARDRYIDKMTRIQAIAAE